MRILVTGGAGYVGSVLVPALLERGHAVTALDSLMHGGRGLLGAWGRRNFRFVRGDVRDAEAVGRALVGAEAVVHLAALVGEPLCARRPREAAEVNALATWRLARAAKAAGAHHFLLASTCSNYGACDGLADEATPLRPQGLYARTKVIAEGAVARLAGGGFSVTVMRFATVYGVSPRMRFDLLPNQLVMEAVTDGKVELYGPDAWRPLVHVRDLTRFVCRLCATRVLWDCETFNIGGHNRHKAELAEALAKLVPGLEVAVDGGKPDPRDYCVDFSKAMVGLDVLPEHTPEGGLAEVAGALRAGLFEDPRAGEWRNA